MNGLIFLTVLWAWFSLGGFIVAKQMGVTKPREILAWTLLFLPIVVSVSLYEIVEILAVLISDGWKGVRRHLDQQFEVAFRELLNRNGS